MSTDPRFTPVAVETTEEEDRYMSDAPRTPEEVVIWAAVQEDRYRRSEADRVRLEDALAAEKLRVSDLVRALHQKVEVGNSKQDKSIREWQKEVNAKLWKFGMWIAGLSAGAGGAAGFLGG